MTKYYRVKKATFMWEEGAILSNEGGGYRTINDIWNAVNLGNEYITDHIIENPENAQWFERVYKVDTVTRTVYEVKEKAKELLNRDFKA